MEWRMDGSVRPYVLLVNGPNLNRLGQRKPEVYGSQTLADVVRQVREVAEGFGVDLRDYQSNSEGSLVDYLQQQGPEALGIVINPGALAHYGLSLRDCLEDIARPTVEVHISNIHRREGFRHHSVLSEVADGQIVGLGTHGYRLATQFLLETLPIRKGN